MNTSNARIHRGAARALLVAAWAGLLAGCGGHVDEPTGAVATAGQPEPVSPLLADDGSAMPSDPRAEPADPGARTRLARYASPAQAEQLERTLGPRVITLQVECCGAEAVERAIGIAYGVQAAADLPRGTPMIVRAADLRLGAIAADRLAQADGGPVWLVTR